MSRKIPWTEAELALLWDISVPLTEVARRTGRKDGTVYAEASVRKIVGRVQGRPRGSSSRLRGNQCNMPAEALQLLAETDLPYSEIAERTGVDRESLRKAAHYRGLANRGQPTGAEAHQWRGGRKERLQAAGDDWDRLRLQILERDGYTCQDCGFVDFSGRELHVHHIIPFRLHRVNEPAWLVTLCRTCHGKRPEHQWESIPDEVAAQLAVSELGRGSTPSIHVEEVVPNDNSWWGLRFLRVARPASWRDGGDDSGVRFTARRVMSW